MILHFPVYKSIKKVYNIYNVNFYNNLERLGI